MPSALDQPPTPLRKIVVKACSHCKKAHLSCDTERPCRRCVITGKDSTCQDMEHKRRGRPPNIVRRSSVATMMSDESSNSSGHHRSYQQQPRKTGGLVGLTRSDSEDSTTVSDDDNRHALPLNASFTSLTAATNLVAITANSPKRPNPVSHQFYQAQQQQQPSHLEQLQHYVYNQPRLSSPVPHQPAQQHKVVPSPQLAHRPSLLSKGHIWQISIDPQSLVILSVKHDNFLGFSADAIRLKLSLYDFVHEVDRYALARFHQSQQFAQVKTNTISAHLRCLSEFKLFNIVMSCGEQQQQQAARLPIECHISEYQHPAFFTTPAFAATMSMADGLDARMSEISR